MPKLPTNMVRRKGRPGYYFRKKSAGKTKWTALGVNYEEACTKLRKMKREEIRFLPELKVKDAAQQCQQCPAREEAAMVRAHVQFPMSWRPPGTVAGRRLGSTPGCGRRTPTVSLSSPRYRSATCCTCSGVTARMRCR